jgi:MoaA/NifB/PqqE/SkfB family radical SAM enzyme
LRRLDPSITKEVVLLTNGLLLDENKLYELKQISINTGVNYSFRVSVDGITKETYEKTRIGGTFEKIIKNINLIKDNFPIQISFTIKKTNYLDAHNVKSFFNQLGFHNIFITADVYDHDMQDVLSELD